MKNKSYQEYLHLIESLLNSTAGEELAILQVNQHLIDDVLIRKIRQAAAEQPVGSEQNGVWLRNLAFQLESSIGNLSMLIEQQPKANKLLEQGTAQNQVGQVEEALQIYQKIGDLVGQMNCLINLGIINGIKQLYKPAIKCFQRSLEISQVLESSIGEAISLGNLGIAHRNLELYQDAIKYHQQVLEIEQKIGERSREAISLRSLGIIYRSLGEYEQAVAVYEQSLLIEKELQNDNGYLNSIQGLAKVFDAQKNYQQAINYYEKSRKIAQKKGLRLEESLSFRNLGSIFRKQGEYKKATKFYHEAYSISQEINDFNGINISSSNLGEIYFLIGKYQEAKKFHIVSLRCAEKTGIQSEQAIYLRYLGDTANSLGDYKEALEHHQQALNINKKIGAQKDSALSLNSLGIIYRNLGEYQKAIQNHSQALEIARQLNDSFLETDALRGIGFAYYHLGQLEKATQHHKQALEIEKEKENLSGQAFSFRGLGNIAEAIGNYPDAIKYHQQALSIERELSNPQWQSFSLGNLGNIYYSLGLYQKAIEKHQEQLTIARKIGDRRGEETALGNIGNAFYALGNYQEAIKYHQQSFQISEEIADPQGVANSLGNQGLCYQSLKEYQKSLKLHQKSLNISREINDLSGQASSLTNIGSSLMALDKYKDALDFQQQSLTIMQKLEDRAGEADVLNNLGLNFLNSGHFKEAQNSLQKGIEVLDSLRIRLEDRQKISIFDIQLRSYRLLQEVLIAQKNIEKALEISERGRARAFAELLYDRRLEQFSQQTLLSSPTITEIKKTAQSLNATIVEYSFVDLNNLLLIWVIPPTGEIKFYQVSLSFLEKDELSFQKLVTQAREVLTETNLEFKSSSLIKLYEMLIRPIIHFLPNNQEDTVIFIPQGILFLVPFTALQDQEGSYLVDKHTIVTAPSIQFLELIQNQNREIQESLREILVVGNPQMPIIPLSEPPEILNSLEWAETEAKAIASLFDTQAITGATASKNYIQKKLTKARIIHLATHGLLDDIRQLGIPGAIALSPGNNDDGFLTSGEIYNMKLNAELVVLSACNTAQGTISGDGVIGLSRSFFAAGVKSLIVSLWSVEDLSTTLLIVKFYQFFQDGINPTLALNQAQRWLLNIKKPELEDWVLENRQFFDPTLKINLKRKLRQFKDNESPFESPCHWAAFCIIGH